MEQSFFTQLDNRFKSEVYVSELHGLYCPMRLIQAIIGANKKFADESFAQSNEEAFLQIRKDWFENLQLLTPEGRISLGNIETLTLGGVKPSATTFDHETVELAYPPGTKLEDIRLEGISASFLQSYLECKSELKALPEIIIVIREIIPDFIPKTATEQLDAVRNTLFEKENEEALRLLVRMTQDIIDDLALIFSKFTTVLR